MHRLVKMCWFREMMGRIFLSHGLVHWVSGGMFLGHCIIPSTMFIVSKGRSVGLNPGPVKAIRFRAGSGSVVGSILTRRNDIQIQKQADMSIFICRMNDQQPPSRINSVSQCFSSQANHSRRMQDLSCTNPLARKWP